MDNIYLLLFALGFTLLFLAIFQDSLYRLLFASRCPHCRKRGLLFHSKVEGTISENEIKKPATWFFYGCEKCGCNFYRDRVGYQAYSGVWDVIWNGSIVAKLSDPTFYDMFWTSYLVVPMSSDTSLIQELMSGRFFFKHAPELVYRQVETGAITQIVIAESLPKAPEHQHRLQFRFLYIKPWRSVDPSPSET